MKRAISTLLGLSSSKGSRLRSFVLKAVSLPLRSTLIGIQLSRAERLLQVLPCCVHEIGAARDLVYLSLGAVATYVGLSQHFVEIRILVDAVHDVLEDLLLMLYLSRVTLEELTPTRTLLSPSQSLLYAKVGYWSLSNNGLSAKVGLYLLQAATSGLRYQEVDKDRGHHTDAGEYPEDRCRAYQRDEREKSL